jgi:signal transduction histidine kinase
MSEVIRILLVDDDEEDYILTRDVLEDIPQKNYILDWVASYQEAGQVIARKAHDVYLIDYRLGAHNGLELIEAAIEDGATSPLILLTGQGDLEIDEKAMKAGAADYMVKGSFNPYHLERSIRYSLEHAKNLNQIRQLNAELEKRVEQRTKDLASALQALEETNQHLKKAEAETLKALEKERELNILKSKFVTIASHEFRTPLSTILSSASLIGKYTGPNDDEKRQKHVARIKSSVNNLTGILNDFLSFGKLEEGKVGYSPGLFDVVLFAEELTEEISAILKEGQTIQYEHRGPEREVFSDKHLLKNALLNLLSNASKYSDPGKAIYLSSEITETELLMSVRDEGMGIPQADQVHLFSRFYRAHNVTAIQGTGLGLTIVKKYVELMDGTIDFFSQEYKGTTFTIKLPLIK